MATGSYMTPTYSRSQSEVQGDLHKVTCEMLLQRHERKPLLYRIATNDKKWILKTRTRRDHALIERRPELARRHDRVILLHDNEPSHTSKPVKDTLKSLGWDILPPPLYFPDLAPSGYHLFASMKHALEEHHFSNLEEVGKWLDEWFAVKDQHFFWHGIHKLLER
ncbi:mariner Mos1 transposase [Trichonephila clavipes]|nr:mariner Mos1 transposase [Trichonephila clavipes]